MVEDKNPDKQTSAEPTNQADALLVEEFKSKLWRSRKSIIIGVVVTVVVLITILVTVKLTSDNKSLEYQTDNNGQRTIELTEAVKAGKRLSNERCNGEGVTTKLAVSPMKPEDFSIVVPYGLVVGGHVTPIDHQYFSPASYNSKPDAYEVRAMGDATLVDIGSRPRPFGEEYRLVFTVSCTFLYYYDLVTSLSPELKQAYEARKNNNESINLQVKAGQVIGRIGGQTLDFAVWDTTKPLSGFIEHEHYEAEAWKIFTADPLDYYTDDLKSFILSRYVRDVEPISGKIDYDEDGKLIGNWFMEGYVGYGGDRQDSSGAYWRTHLSFAPDLYDPTWFIISIGSYATEKDGLGAQFVTPTNSPQPQDVSVDTGMVKYELTQWNYIDGKGSSWNRTSLVKGLKVTSSSMGTSGGCAVVEMIDARKIKFEVFKNKSCDSVAGFTSEASIYTR